MNIDETQIETKKVTKASKEEIKTWVLTEEQQVLAKKLGINVNERTCLKNVRSFIFIKMGINSESFYSNKSEGWEYSYIMKKDGVPVKNYSGAVYHSERDAEDGLVDELLYVLILNEKDKVFNQPPDDNDDEILSFSPEDKVDLSKVEFPILNNEQELPLESLKHPDPDITLTADLVVVTDEPEPEQKSDFGFVKVNRNFMIGYGIAFLALFVTVVILLMR
jgi:hypothetical protein